MQRDAHGPFDLTTWWESGVWTTTESNFDSELTRAIDHPHPSVIALQSSNFPLTMKSKAGKSGEQESSYAVKDVVLAKIRGYPAWPGLVKFQSHIA